MTFISPQPILRRAITVAKSAGKGSSSVGQSSDHEILKLDVAGVALQADVSCRQAIGVGRDRVVCDRLAIKHHLDERIGGLDFEGVPLTGRFGRDRRGWRQRVNGPRMG
jgi:hypothetical protein